MLARTEASVLLALDKNSLRNFVFSSSPPGYFYKIF